MARTRNELPPPLSMQQAIDGAFIDLMTHLCFEHSLDLACGRDFSALGTGKKGRQELTFLFHHQILVAPPTLARGFESGRPQAIVAGNDAPYCRDRDAGVLGNLFRFARRNQGTVNDPPALYLDTLFIVTSTEALK